MAGCRELLSGCLSAGHRGALGTAEGGAVLGLTLWMRLLLGPPVCVSPSVLTCSPVFSHSGILCFPPSLNFGMKMGLESGTLLSRVMS